MFQTSSLEEAISFAYRFITSVDFIQSPVQTEKHYLVATGDTSKTKLHKPLSEKSPNTLACKPVGEYRRVSESVGKRIIGVSESASEEEWKCLSCFFKDKIEYGKSIE
jgi:hypothetical protein